MWHQQVCRRKWRKESVGTIVKTAAQSGRERGECGRDGCFRSNLGPWTLETNQVRLPLDKALSEGPSLGISSGWSVGEGQRMEKGQVGVGDRSGAHRFLSKGSVWALGDAEPVLLEPRGCRAVPTAFLREDTGATRLLSVIRWALLPANTILLVIALSLICILH